MVLGFTCAILSKAQLEGRHLGVLDLVDGYGSDSGCTLKPQGFVAVVGPVSQQKPAIRFLAKLVGRHVSGKSCSHTITQLKVQTLVVL